VEVTQFSLEQFYVALPFRDSLESLTQRPFGLRRKFADEISDLRAESASSLLHLVYIRESHSAGFVCL
jgi:hypothetical protein